MIPYSRQEITSEDISEVKKVLKSNFLTQGPCVPRFEKLVAAYCNVSNAIAVNSATSALHIACIALGLQQDDYLWTSPNTFVASVNCARYCGANVDFVDIDPNTYNMSCEVLSHKLNKAEKQGKLPKIVIPVHYSGLPCDMPKIYALSKKYGFKIIEDASHATGASYDQYKIGSCKHSNITVMSFHPVKIITTGEGGVALTNDNKLAEKMSILRTHGITKDLSLMKKRAKNEIWNYQQIELGFNYRMSDIHAALGISQMKRLDSYVKARNNIAEFYDREFFDLSVKTPFKSTRLYSSYHLYPVRIKESDMLLENQKKLYEKFWKKGIAVNLHYIPVHRHPYYENLGFKKGQFPESEKFYSEAISLPIFPNLTNLQQKKVIKTLAESIKKS